jgi:MFS-type transporter involved in bile tolerance (Atg22 family)
MATDTRSPKRRQTSASTSSRQTPAPAATYSGHTISWRHCLLGLVVGEVALLVISNAALIATNAAFGSSGNLDGGVVGVSTLLAVILGGWLAARLAGRFGLYQGIVVAIGFIAVGAVYTFFQESSTIAAALSTNSHHLIDLGPMDLGNLFSGDLLALFGGSVGGLLSGKR